MKIIKPIFYAILIVLIFSAVDCRKKDEPVYYIPLNNGFLSYVSFPVGSWWVYEEVNTGKRDSIYVVINNTLKKENRQDNNYYYQLEFRLKNNFGEYYFWARPDKNIFLNDTVYTCTEAYNLNNGTYTAIRFFYSKQRDTLYSINDNTYIKNIFDTLILNSSLYTDIYQIENSNQLYGNQIKSEYYSKNIGIIRKELFDSTIWELKKYFINK